MNIEVTVSRIQKLLALAADGGATEAEAESALAKAHEIMAMHNLTMATVEATGKQATGDARRAKEEQGGKAMFKYQQRLMASLAKVNYCHVRVNQTFKGRRWYDSGYTIIGRESNVAALRVMFDYLNQTINRLVLEELDGQVNKRISRWAISWCDGCASRLADRVELRHERYLRKQAEEARAANEAQRASGSTGNALVVVMEDHEQNERDQNNDFRNGWEPGTTARRRAEQKAAEKAAAERLQAEADELELAGGDPRVVELMRTGYYSHKEATRKVSEEDKLLNETPAQKAKRRAREERENAKWERYWNNQTKNRDWGAYERGQQAAENIGLDPQVGSSPAKRIG